MMLALWPIQREYHKCTEEKGVEEKEPKLYPGLQRHPGLTYSDQVETIRLELLSWCRRPFISSPFSSISILAALMDYQRKGISAFTSLQ